MSEVYDIAGISSLDSINQDIVSRNNSIRNTKCLLKSRHFILLTVKCLFNS